MVNSLIQTFIKKLSCVGQCCDYWGLISSSSVSQWADKVPYGKIIGGLTLRGEGSMNSQSKAETK